MKTNIKKVKGNVGTVQFDVKEDDAKKKTVGIKRDNNMKGVNLEKIKGNAGPVRFEADKKNVQVGVGNTNVKIERGAFEKLLNYIWEFIRSWLGNGNSDTPQEPNKKATP